MNCTGNIHKALILYAMTGQIEDLKRVITKGAKINTSTAIGGHTALMHAADRGHNIVVDLLLQHGADANIKDHEGHTALYYANAAGHPQIEAALKAAQALAAQRPPPLPPRPQYDIDEILQEPTPAKVIARLMKELSKPDLFLTAEEQIVTGVQDLEMQVCWDGFSGYFFNRTRRQVENSISGLEKIGGAKTLGLVRQALSIFEGGRFPDGGHNFSAEVQEKTEAHKDFLNKLDSQFYDREENLEQLLFDYIANHKRKFKPAS